MGGSWQLDLGQLAGLAGAVVLVGAGLWVLWAARHRSEHERVVLPVVGRVGNPTCLTLGLCLLGCGYHAAAYSLLPGVVLVAIPIDRWWILVVVCAVAMSAGFAADAVESRGGDAE